MTTREEINRLRRGDPHILGICIECDKIHVHPANSKTADHIRAYQDGYAHCGCLTGADNTTLVTGRGETPTDTPETIEVLYDGRDT